MPMLKEILIFVAVTLSMPTANLKIRVTTRSPTAAENRRMYRAAEEVSMDKFKSGGTFYTHGLLFLRAPCRQGGKLWKANL
jgi:hypothetical protein